MSKHTPGPWTAQEDCRGRFAGTLPGIDNPLPRGTLAYGIYGQSTRIAVLEQSQEWRPQERIDADAALIAAAPELLKACESALAWLSYCDMTDTAQYARLELAIAKAKGGESCQP